ncbi:hypothetical protein ACFE04_032013 [Oxalis oulophora]
MSAASPAISNSSADTTPFHHRTPKSLRGQNKPKCVQCGNVARSRCPYESCKNCCAKAQNPCHIHVLKQNATLDKTPPPSIPLFEQKTEVSTPGFRQVLYFTFYLDATSVFTKTSFCPTTLLEKLDTVQQCSVTSCKETINKKEDSVEDESNYDESQNGIIVSGLKLKLSSNPVRIDNFRNRMQEIVNVGFKKLQQYEADGDGNESNEAGTRTKKLRAERTLAFSDLNEKLNKAQSEDDLRSCLRVKSQLSSAKTGNENVEQQQQPAGSLPKLCTTVQIDEESLKKIDANFSSLEQVEDL